jgi:hypothetical protein
VEAGSNISIVALRIVRGDEKGIQCLGYNQATVFLGGYKYEDLALQVGGSLESGRIKCGYEPRGART